MTPIRRQRADAPDLDPNRAEVRESTQGEGRNRERFRIDRLADLAELRVRDKLIERHARAEQVADRRRVVPRHAHTPRNRREHPSENLLEAQVRESEQVIDERLIKTHASDQSLKLDDIRLRHNVLDTIERICTLAVA